ncbi:hypothetical protein HDF18_00615 [Mucilaginibacter sp. X5P1]|uniref:hypothetical protein n=1 Tax=Mucilaginibacter sp. X5P1 TaxID=2723088 RepID=UPI001617A493|nr:hypothetical protein [Mucilaginibacter sp. X5P1]MBB6138401.1 peptidoglycan hydrolase CwlO-like protein [Mucilaginibacter sp. X5P1]
MKKVIIVAVVVLSSVITAFALSRKDVKKDIITLKIQTSDFALKNINAPKSDLATAD